MSADYSRGRKGTTGALFRGLGVSPFSQVCRLYRQLSSRIRSSYPNKYYEISDKFRACVIEFDIIIHR